MALPCVDTSSGSGKALKQDIHNLPGAKMPSLRQWLINAIYSDGSDNLPSFACNAHQHKSDMALNKNVFCIAHTDAIKAEIQL
ncbi:hypothetical protein ACUN8C_16335 [Kushneria sp. Sum13]|uniref:hypothetical protein n=1 Tax=Kushneria sp. Sum13 TaxID=3459196 RepID=UPI004045A910